MSGWTKTPNFIFELMPEMHEAELKIVMLIIRETIGWKREEWEASFTDMAKLTNLSKRSVVTGVSAALERGVITRKPSGNSYVYSIKQVASDDGSVQNLHRSDPVTVQNLHQQEDTTVQNLHHPEPISVQNLHQNDDISVQILHRSTPTLKKEDIKKTTNKEKDIVAPATATLIELPEPKQSSSNSKTKNPPTLAEQPPRELSEWQRWLLAFCWICHGHQEIGDLTEMQSGQLTSEGKKIRDKGYTVENLKQWYTTVWQLGWKYKNDPNQRPLPSHVRSDIAKIKNQTPSDFEDVENGASNGTGGRQNQGNYRKPTVANFTTEERLAYHAEQRKNLPF